jgi:hypothetical protein
MDAASFSALSTVLDRELPSALEGAMLELERSRMLRADEEHLRGRLIDALDHCHFCMSRALFRHEMDPPARYYAEGVKRRCERELKKAGAMSDDEADDEEGAVDAAEEVADDEEGAMDDE